jgi:hypothetical protein
MYEQNKRDKTKTTSKEQRLLLKNITEETSHHLPR